MSIDDINFKLDLIEIKNILLNSNKYLDYESDDLLFDYYTKLIRLRHDILHLLILKMLGREWVPEVSIINYFDISTPSPLLNRTPDIIHKFNNKFYIIDVSISVDYHISSKTKNDKYLPICDWLISNLGIDVSFIHINFSSSFRNWSTEIIKLKDIALTVFDDNYFFDIIRIIENKKEIVSKFIDKKFFDEQKLRKFNKIDENFDNIGKYKDVDIDVEKFINFNNQFDHLDKIKTTINNYNENDIIVLLKDILEDDNNPVKKTYKDNMLSIDQFENANNIIKNKNISKNKMEPKPTHHILIPFTEEIVGLEQLGGVGCEQKMINNFTCFLHSEQEILKQNTKSNFLLELLNELKKIYDGKVSKNNLNNQTYKQIYETGTINDDNFTKEKYQEWKTMCGFYYAKWKSIDNNDNKNIKKYMIPSTKKFFKNIKDKETFINELIMPNNFEYYKENLSYNDYLKINGKLFDDDFIRSYPVKQKTIYYIPSKSTENFHNVWSKTGIKHFKTKMETNKRPVDSTINFDEYGKVDRILNKLSENCETKFDYEYYCNLYADDSEEVIKMKKLLIEGFKPSLEYLVNTQCFHYLLRNHYVSTQLLHFTTLNMKPNTFSIFNAGIPNAIYIVAGCYNNILSEDGKPFMCAIITKYPENYTNFFGKIYKIELTGGYTLVVTNWRRLPSMKLIHIKDSFYSVLSSTMNSLMSCTKEDSYMQFKKYDNIFSLRTIISICTNQKVAELLMDNRYAYMSSFSIYTNIMKLLTEKFGPPYSCCLDVWIVNKLLTKLPIIHQSIHNNDIKLKDAEFINEIRDLYSIGGDIKIPSLWGDYYLTDVHEIMDEAFIYVHTMKEPSNMFHENIKAIKTILKFQNEYNNLNEKQKTGCLNTKKDIYEFLLSDSTIGFYSPIIYHSVKHTIESEKPNIGKYVDEINYESLSEIVSTKAVIADTEREIIELKHKTKRIKEKQEKKIEKYDKDKENIINQDKKTTDYYLKTETKFYTDKKTRQKVFETILSKIIEDDNISRVVELANKHIVKDNGKTIADICIKSQYGAKREFYVINIGAKAIARCTESFFKMLSENSPNEAISIPGDVKTIEMQKMLNRIYKNIPDMHSYKLCYVNGDCTKWSAAETMGSFITMIYAMEDKLPIGMYNLLLATFNSWSKKEIQIPMDIYNKVIIPSEKSKDEFHLDETLLHLKNKKIVKNGKIQSTQNFLQGMFNYSSSYKAVCCINYTYHLWKKIYPSSKLIIEHMEHSDDYVIIVLYQKKEELENFRILQKIMMRFHGYNDSDRKTSCQFIFMEFVSQMSFNGVMIYPQIKKTKEINTNLPCIGYKQDMDSALSRVKECMRVGCSQSFLLFFQRLHTKCVSDFYSTTPGLHNSLGRSYEELFNTPVELFGIPDPFPLFSLYCRGNANNYRIYNYSRNKNMIIYLYKKAQQIKKVENILFDDPEYSYSLYTPKFAYEMLNRNIIRIRKKLRITTDEVKEFWEKYPSYRFIKPRTNSLLKKWLKVMFFNRLFTEAYTKSTRTKMIMRVAYFNKNKTIINYENKETLFGDFKDNITIEKFITDTISDYKKQELLLQTTQQEEKEILKIICKCDSTYSAIYSLLQTIKIMEINRVNKGTIQICTKTPRKIRSFDIVNSPSTILQYIYNPNEFLLDDRKCFSFYSICQDVEKIKERIGDQLQNKDPMNILTIYNDLMICKEKRIIMIAHEYNMDQLHDSINSVIKNNFVTGFECLISQNQIIEIIDPFTNTLVYYKGLKATPDLYQQILENICLLFTYLNLKENKSINYIRNFLEDLTFKTNDLNNPYINPKTLFDKLTLSYFEQHDVDYNIKKITGYLASVLYNNNDVLDDLTKTVYNYSYKYLEKAKYMGGEYYGNTIINMTHLQTTHRIIQLDTGKQMPILIYHNNYPANMIVVHYNLALRLLGFLSDEELIINNQKNRIREFKLPFKTTNDAKNFFKENKIINLCKSNSDGQITRISITDYNLAESYLPIMISTRLLYKGAETKIKLTSFVPRADFNRLGVFVGKEKVYTLPFWKCRQYNNIANTNKEIDGLKLNDIFKYSLLSNYLTKNNMSISPLNPNYNLWEKKNDLTYYIQENKLYNCDIGKGFIDYIGMENYNYLVKEDLINIFYRYEKKLTIQPKKIEETKEIINIDQENLKILDEEFMEKSTEKLEALLVKELQSDDDFLDFTGDEIIDDSMINHGLMDDDIYISPSEYKTKTIKDLDFSLVINDYFVERPVNIIRTRNQYTTVNYVKNKVNHTPTIGMLQKMFFYQNIQRPFYSTITNFLCTLKYTIDKIRKSTTTEEKNCSLVMLYLLMCNTYIQKTKIKNFSFMIDNITHSFIYEIESTTKKEQLIKQLKEKGTLLNYNEKTDSGGEIYYKYIVSVSIKMFITKHSDYSPPEMLKYFEDNYHELFLNIGKKNVIDDDDEGNDFLNDH